MEIEWQEPPEYAQRVGTGHQPGRYLEFAVALREHPGRWAVLPSHGQARTEKGANATAQNIRRGKVKGFTPANTYETAVHGTKIWVRYKDQQEQETAPAKSDGGQQDDGDSITPDARQVRAWANQQGMEVPDRGRLPKELFDKYEQAVARGEVGLGLRAVRD